MGWFGKGEKKKVGPNTRKRNKTDTTRPKSRKSFTGEIVCVLCKVWGKGLDPDKKVSCNEGKRGGGKKTTLK